MKTWSDLDSKADLVTLLGQTFQKPVLLDICYRLLLSESLHQVPFVNFVSP